MEKSKLGISLNLFAAMLYFLGASSNTLIVAIALCYILLFEENERLKKTAVKALILTVFFEIILLLTTWLTNGFYYIFSSFNAYRSYVINSNRTYSYNYLFQFLQYIPQNINSIIRIIGILIFVIFGFRTYKEKDIKIKWIDNIIDKNLWFTKNNTISKNKHFTRQEGYSLFLFTLSICNLFSPTCGRYQKILDFSLLLIYNKD